MASDVDTIAAVVDRLREAADLVGRFEHDRDDRRPAEEFVGGRQTRGPAPMMIAFIYASV